MKNSPSLRMDSQCKYAAIARGDASVYLRLPTRPGCNNILLLFIIIYTYETTYVLISIYLRGSLLIDVERVWDHAAGALLVRESGGKVSDVRGRPLDFSRGRGLNGNLGIVATNGAVCRRARDCCCF
jgi:3'(2'), 5'-bisphosphate nucleotidase